MIPIRDTVHSERFPLINTMFIVLNVLVFLFQTSLGSQALEQVVFAYGLVPAKFWSASGLDQWLPVFTSMFLHGGWWHLISNMLALYIFGDNIEDRMGHGRYLVFYLLGGVVAGLTHAWTYSQSSVPTVGASGAIAAILGAYLVLYPQARVITLIPLPLFLFFPMIEIPALAYLGIWFVSQLLNGAFALAATTFQEAAGVAWWAHIGGFVAGMILVGPFILGRPRREPRGRYYPDEYYPW
jgi:membrane associated rhomboid family serine protease